MDDLIDPKIEIDPAAVAEAVRNTPTTPISFVQSTFVVKATAPGAKEEKEEP
jgi:hypothetical protein